MRKILFCSFLCIYIPINSQNIHLVFRYDDYMLKNNSTDSNVVSVFLKHHVPLVLGIIPCDSREQFVCQPDFNFKTKLQQAVKSGAVEISLHGLNHQKLTSAGEFAGLEYRQQRDRLLTGKLFLDSVFDTHVISFIPPWNAYDSKTLDALHDCGFSVISSSIPDKNFDRKDMEYYPHSLGDFNLLITEIQKNKDRDGLIVVMIHAYDFKTARSIQQLDSVLAIVSSDKEISLRTFRGLSEVEYHVNEKLIKAQWHKCLLMKMLGSDYTILSLSYIRIIQVLNSLLYLFASLFVFFILGKLLPKVKNRKNLLIMLIVFETLLVVISYANLLSPMKLLVIAVLFPIVLKGLNVFFYTKK